MQVILKKEVAGLGRAGDVVKVKDGYARNYLIPVSYTHLGRCFSPAPMSG